MGARKGSKWSNRSCSVTLVSKSSRYNSCLSIKFTSANPKPKPSKPLTVVYLAQCLFFGLESFRFLAARIREARKMRWTVHRIPLATGGSLDRSRVRYTRELIKVGTCTEDR